MDKKLLKSLSKFGQKYRLVQTMLVFVVLYVHWAVDWISRPEFDLESTKTTIHSLKLVRNWGSGMVMRLGSFRKQGNALYPNFGFLDLIMI